MPTTTATTSINGSSNGEALMSEQQQERMISRSENSNDDVNRGYEQIMGIVCPNSNDIINESSSSNGKLQNARTAAAEALSNRLTLFRKWLSDEAKVTVHPAVAIVNGEATDGTRNAPVLALALPTSPLADAAGASGSNGGGGSSSGGGVNNKTNAASSITGSTITANTTVASAALTGGRIGSIDGQGDQSLYDRTMGCQVRAVREIRKNEVLMTVPRSAMITPDVVACSDAGRAVLACCRPPLTIENSSTGEKQEIVGLPSFWDAFSNTMECQAKFNPKISRNSGPQLLVKILQERKKAESAYAKRVNNSNNSEETTVQLAEYGTISTRAPVLAFLIHQRFSNQERPLVVSESSATAKQFQRAQENPSGNALQAMMNSNTNIKVDPDGNNNNNNNNSYRLQLETPATFAPYARTLPAVVSLPICWKRGDLALMSGCIPGISFLQEVAARTMQLANEFIALIEAGILERFPETFPPGMITWERWVWAASISSSRVLPASCYLDKGCVKAESFTPLNKDEFQSPPEIWDELGVMLPLLDMLNHESEAHQVTWKPCVPDERGTNSNGNRGQDAGGGAAADMDDDDDEEEPHPPRAIVHKKVRKGAEIYCAYGNLSNHNLVLQYGMAQMNNPADEVKIGWGLTESVGNMKTPPDFTPVVDMENGVYDSTDKSNLDAWWSHERLQLLQREAFSNTDGNDLVESLKQGKKLSATAFSDGAYHPVFITAAVVATMPEAQVRQFAKGGGGGAVIIYPRHLGILRNFLAYSFSRKLEKLLQNLATGLKAHYGNLQLWTKSSNSGIRYQGAGAQENSDNHGDEEGWQTFFDTHAYRSTMEVEKRYYAMGPECCVLTLYDGQLRALQSSLDGVVDDEKFKSGLQSQLVDLGFEISDKEPPEPDALEQTVVKQEKASPKEVVVKKEDTKPPAEGPSGSDKKTSPSRRKRNRKKSSTTITNSVAAGNRPPALKLHVGNLSYSTTPSDLYDFFSSIYGKDNILECHIPLERETSRSRGFGFVTMPENAAQRALTSGKKHEIDGRLLKVARSNSAGTSESGKARPGPAAAVSDRCSNCGYGPRYCYCAANGPPGPHRGFPPPPLPPPPGPPPHLGPPHLMPPGPDRDHRHYGSHDGHRDDRYRDDHRGREDYYGRHRDYERGRDRAARYESSPPRGGGGGYSDYDRDYDREDRYRSKRRRSRDRSPRSHSSSRRSRDYDDHNSTSRSSRRDSRRSVDDDEWEQSRKRSRSRSRSPRSRSRSRSRSPRERSRKKKGKKREL